MPVRGTTIPNIECNPTEVVTLTKDGHRVLSRGQVARRDQATHHGLKKPREVAHDADLYRLYNKVTDEIETEASDGFVLFLDERPAAAAREAGGLP
jgi:hypothetical protein